MIHPRTLRSLDYFRIIEHAASLCVSAPGRDMALNTRPLASAQMAESEFSLYEQISVWAAHPCAKQFALSSFEDVSPLIDRAARRLSGQDDAPALRLDLDELWVVRQMLDMGHGARNSIASADGSQWPALLELATSAPQPSQLAAALKRCISDDGILKDESSPELYRLRNEIRSLHQGCLRKVREYAQKYNMLAYLQDEFMTLSSDRYVLPLKANFKGRMQGIIHDWSQTGETCYFEPMFLVDVNNRLQELKHEEREEERKVLDYLSGLFVQELEGVQGCLALLSTLDMYLARKKFADAISARCISFTSDEEGIYLPESRHPGMALACAEDEGPEPKPLDIVLRPGERVLVITGGNAGGKTVCLKTLGLCAALAMSGFPITAGAGSHLPWFERLDAFIGDEQSLEDRVSTFTAQIDHLARAWKHLGRLGLVLLDEFGAGTDPAEGAALAQAVLDGLLEKNCFVLAATHFPALKSYALTRDGVRAASMVFNPQTHRPLFKIAYDQVGASQALAVAAAHGLPESILARARHYLLQDGADSSQILARLNTLAAEREVEIEALRNEQARAQRSLADKTDKLEKERKKLERDIHERIAELMRAWKSGKASARQTMKDFSGLREELGLSPLPRVESVLPPAQDLKIGMRVHHAGFNKSGVITDIDDRKQRARLDLDGVAVWGAFTDLRAGGASAVKAAVSRVAPGASAGGFVLDVRGQRADEAVAMVESFLDRALLAGYSEVEIVHGRGTGALRREIHALLKRSPHVASVALAPADRGGDGMTIVGLE